MARVESTQSFWMAVFLGLAATLSACGGSPISQVCQSATEQLFKTCDPNKEEDVLAIWNAVQGMGGSISSQEISNTSRAEIANECERSMSEAKVQLTSDEAKKFKEAVAQTTTCEATVEMIRINVGQLL